MEIHKSVLSRVDLEVAMSAGLKDDEIAVVEKAAKK